MVFVPHLADALVCTEVGASRTMIQRTEDRFGIKPDWLAGDDDVRS